MSIIFISIKFFISIKNNFMMASDFIDFDLLGRIIVGAGGILKQFPCLVIDVTKKKDSTKSFYWCIWLIY